MIVKLKYPNANVIRLLFWGNHMLYLSKGEESEEDWTEDEDEDWPEDEDEEFEEEEEW